MIKTKYHTADGQVFDDITKARQHEKTLALANFSKALEAYCKGETEALRLANFLSAKSGHLRELLNAAENARLCA